MNLEILSIKEALNYEPKKNSYGIRIESPFNFRKPLKESKNWIKINNYDFNDMWPEDYKEYDWVKPKDIFAGGIWEEGWEKYSNFVLKYFESVSFKNFISFLETEGYPFSRYTLFDENIAKKILNDFEEVEDKVDNVMIHCIEGRNRSPAIGKAMNDIYGWRIKGLEKKFPKYRRYIYDVMMKAEKNR